MLRTVRKKPLRKSFPSRTQSALDLFKQNEKQLKLTAARHVPLQEIPDILQETALKILKSRIRLNPNRNPIPWLHKVVQNTCIDWLRKSKTKRKTPEGSGRELNILGRFQETIALDLRTGRSTGTPEEIRMRKEQTGQFGIRFRAAFRSLSQQDQRILLLAFAFNEPPTRIAKQEGILLGTVKSRIHNARNRLQKALELPSWKTGRRPRTGSQKN